MIHINKIPTTKINPMRPLENDLFRYLNLLRNFTGLLSWCPLTDISLEI